VVLGHLPGDSVRLSCLGKGISDPILRKLPSNILLSNSQIVKLTDFGLARRLSEIAKQTETIGGTPDDLAPETLAGVPVDVRSDVYSLGVTLGDIPLIIRAKQRDAVTMIFRESRTCRKLGHPPFTESGCLDHERSALLLIS
jgi:serine/threonine protein kinase